MLLRSFPALCLGLGLILGALQACGADTTRAQVVPATCLLAHASAGRELPEIEVVHRLSAKLGQDGWQVEGFVKEVEHQANGASTQALLLSAADKPTLTIPGPFGRNSFNQVALRLVAPGRVDVALDLLIGTRTRIVGRKQLRGDASGEIAILFDLPLLEWARANTPMPEVDAIRLRFHKGSPRFLLVAVELLKKPWERFLPNVEDGPELVMLGSDGRRAVGIRSGDKLTCALAPEVGSSLRFAGGILPVMPKPTDKHELEVVLHEGGKEHLRQRLPLCDDQGQVFRGWQEARLDLTAFAGRALTAEFQLDAPSASPTVCALTVPYVCQEREQPPTVLLITSDTHRGDHLGCAEKGVKIETPSLDALAQRGTIFRQCYVASNATRPSHATLLTGATPLEHGILTNEARLTSMAPTLAEAFRDSGYLTFAVVSAPPLFPGKSGLEQGFERYSRDDNLQRASADSIEQLLAWLPGAEGKPLFVWLHLFDAHTPYTPPPDLLFKYFPKNSPATRPVPAGIRLGWKPRIDDLDFIASTYKAEITGLDRELAQLLAHPRMAEALVAFTADHGESLMAHEIYFSHAGLYLDSLHVPLLLAGPGVPAGGAISDPIEQIHLGRTLLDLAGLPHVPFPGENLFRAESSGKPRFAIASNSWAASITHGKWHLILHLRGRTGQLESNVLQMRSEHQVELYDLLADPDCNIDLADKEHEQARKLRSALVRWLAGAPAQNWCDEDQPLDYSDRQTLAALGYASGDESAPANALWDSSCACFHCKRFE